MRIYGISGLGADKRVFEYLTFDYPFTPIEWIDPLANESLKDYSRRLSKAIETSSEFILIGVSFGGLVAVEISKLLQPKCSILISSIETHEELPVLNRLAGKFGLVELIPHQLFVPPKIIARYLFGARNTALLDAIINDTDSRFAKWAVKALLNWDNSERNEHCIRIHGTKDRLIPWNSDSQVELIENGSHFMVVDQADVISECIRRNLKRVLR